MIEDRQDAGRAVPRGSVRLAISGALARELADGLERALIDAGYTVSAGAASDVTPEADQRGAAGAARPVGVLVADHDDPVVAGFSASWHAAGMPSLVVVQHHPDVRIGPLDVPGTELCAACFATRTRQHDMSGKASDARPAEHGPATSVDGFPPYLLALVVALVVDRLGVINDAAEHRNEVTVVNAASLVTRDLRVVPVNLCPECSDQKPIGLLAGQEPMFPDLSRVPR